MNLIIVQHEQGGSSLFWRTLTIVLSSIYMCFRRSLWASDYSCVSSVSGLIAASPTLTSVCDVRWRLNNDLLSAPLDVTPCHFSLLGFSGCLWCSDGSFLPASCVWSSFLQRGALHSQSQTPEGAVVLRMPARLCWSRLWQSGQWWGLGLLHITRQVLYY